MGKESSGRSFGDHLKDAPLAPDTSAKVVLTGEVKRSGVEGKFVFSSPELGTRMLDIDAVLDYEPVEDGLTRITLEASSLTTMRPRRFGPRGAVPFIMATPHHASADVIRAQFRRGEASAPILDVETAYLSDIGGGMKHPDKDFFGEETLPSDPFCF
jgi:hypothetical protein